MKSGNLNFLEPSGPLQACNETALTFTFYTTTTTTTTTTRHIHKLMKTVIIKSGMIQVSFLFVLLAGIQPLIQTSKMQLQSNPASSIKYKIGFHVAKI
jgi:hypothetical protein